MSSAAISPQPQMFTGRYSRPMKSTKTPPNSPVKAPPLNNASIVSEERSLFNFTLFETLSAIKEAILAQDSAFASERELRPEVVGKRVLENKDEQPPQKSLIETMTKCLEDSKVEDGRFKYEVMEFRSGPLPLDGLNIHPTTGLQYNRAEKASIVIMNGKNQAGFMHLHVYHYPEGEAYLYLVNIEIEAEFQGDGLGRQLLQMKTEITDRLGASARLSVESSMPFTAAAYRRRGYEVTPNSKAKLVNKHKMTPGLSEYFKNSAVASAHMERPPSPHSSDVSDGKVCRKLF